MDGMDEGGEQVRSRRDAKHIEAFRRRCSVEVVTMMLVDYQEARLHRNTTDWQGLWQGCAISRARQSCLCNASFAVNDDGGFGERGTKLETA
jgi:hypothetical protein